MILIAIVLGIVEGLTEFLPISSTGHLIVAGHLMGFSGTKESTFQVVIQLGAILAVVSLYWSRVKTLFSKAERHAEGFKGPRGLMLLGVITLPPLLVGYISYSHIKDLLFTPMAVAIGFIVGALLIFYVEKRQKKVQIIANSLDAINFRQALTVGLFQCLSLWPGMSRSGSSIIGGMLGGCSRAVAVELSFLAAIPLIFAAAGYDILMNWRLFSLNDLGALTVGFVVSFLAARISVRLLVEFVQRHTLAVFAWYRLAVGCLIILYCCL